MKSNYAKLLMLVALMWTGSIYANNIQVTINSYDVNLKKLNITLSWDNSWHDGTGTFRDAAWLFVKYKDATMSSWQTAPVSVPAPSAILSTGNNVRFEAVGKNPIAATPAADFRGIIIRRAKVAGVANTDSTMTGVYNVSMAFSIPFAFPGSPANPEFKIFALEMVDVPQGAFWAGDGSSYSNIKASVGVSSPKNITSNALTSLSNGSGNISVPASYPEGYDEFYIMKYELSQEGYVEFLNSLTRAEQNTVINNSTFINATSNVATSSLSGTGIARGSISSVQGGSPSLVSVIFNGRQGIKAVCTSLSDPAVFSCDLNNNGIMNEGDDGQTLPIVPNRVTAILHYLNWAGLSPLSELEFEKAARGTAYPVQGEYSWGSNLYYNPSTTISAGAPDENVLLVLGPGFTPPSGGPLGEYIPSTISLGQSSLTVDYRIHRCGLFANASSTRVSSGGSYYGVMDLSNNAFELVYSVSETTFQGQLGDGSIGNIWPSTVLNKSLRISAGENKIGVVSYSGDNILITDPNMEINSLIGIRGVVR